MFNSAVHEIFSANRYENANSSWHFHSYGQRNFLAQLCIARENSNLQLLVIWGLLAWQKFHAQLLKKPWISRWSKSGPSCSKHRKLNELAKGHFVNCFSRFNTQYSDIFCWKNVSSFCTAKATHIFFSKKFQHICVRPDVNFNESLTNNIISFEQLGPVLTLFSCCCWGMFCCCFFYLSI